MLTTAEMLSLANKKRDDAVKARRWAKSLTTLIDQGRLLHHAIELKSDADDLERQAGIAK